MLKKVQIPWPPFWLRRPYFNKLLWCFWSRWSTYCSLRHQEATCQSVRTCGPKPNGSSGEVMEVAVVRRESWASAPGSPARSLLPLRSQHMLWPRLDSSTCEQKKQQTLGLHRGRSMGKKNGRHTAIYNLRNWFLSRWGHKSWNQFSSLRYWTPKDKLNKDQAPAFWRNETFCNLVLLSYC